MTVPSCLYENPEYEEDEDAIDIVAVHGPGGHHKHTWTDPKTGKLWLQDPEFIPKRIKKARVLSFGYSLGGLSVQDDVDDDDSGHCSSAPPHPIAHFATLRNIKNLATSLITSLYSDRGLKKCHKRPIVFVCHGLGGVIVQQALIQSESYRSSPELSTAHSIYLSTGAILFFSTPFDAIDEQTWLALKTIPYLDPSCAMSNKKGDQSSNPAEKLKAESSKVSEILWATAQAFRQIMTSMSLHFFWEDCETDFGDHRRVIVPQDNAAPNLPHANYCGIQATYNYMVRLGSPDLATSYLVVSESLWNFSERGILKIKNAWTAAEKEANDTKLLKSSKRLGIEVPADHTPERKLEKDNLGPLENCYQPPAMVSNLFVGRLTERQIIQDAFFKAPASAQELVRPQKRFVVYGIGGSGKTELCRKFAEDNKERYYAVFTITAASPEEVASSFAKIGEAARLSTQATEEQGKDWLSNHGSQNRPWLLIVDNADDENLKLIKLVPSGGNGHILINTRNEKYRGWATVGYLKLTGLEEEDATRLLFDRADIHGPWDNDTKAKGKTIARAMGCLARAVVQAGSTIMCNNFTLDEYLKHWEGYRKKRRAKEPTREDEDQIFAAFDVSLDFLKQRGKENPQQQEREDCKDALDLLNVISFYRYEGIPVEAFYRAMKNSGSDAVQVDNSSKPALPQFIRQDGQRTKFEFGQPSGLCVAYLLPALTMEVRLSLFTRCYVTGFVMAWMGQWKGIGGSLP